MSIEKVTKQNGTRYIARWRENGRQRKAAFRTRKQAEEAERIGNDRERARRHGLFFDRGPITYDDLCERYLDQHQVSPRTIRTLRERLTYSRRTFGRLPVRELLPEEISRWNAALPLAACTRAHALRAMRQALAAGVRWGYLGRNPAGAGTVQMPATPTKEITPFESWADVSAVADAAAEYGPLIVFACATGLRPQEWQALRWRDLDWHQRRCHVLRTVQDGGTIAPVAKTNGSLRTIVLQQRALDAVAPLARPIDRDALVFPSPEGGIINLSNWRKRVWRPALATAGLHYRPLYEMRHTFATLALAAGAPLEWISKQLGHADTRITLKHYARFLPAADDRALAALNDFEPTPIAPPVPISCPSADA